MGCCTSSSIASLPPHSERASSLKDENEKDPQYEKRRKVEVRFKEALSANLVRNAMGEVVQINEYIVKEELGRSSKNSWVSLCYNEDLKADFVVKKLSRSQLLDDAANDAIYNEVGLFRSLDCEHIVKLYEVIVDPDFEHTYLVMEYMAGGCVLRVEPSGHTTTSYPEKKLKIWTRQILAGLEYLHSRNIIHHNIHPENILMSADGQTVKLADFGLSHSFQNDDDQLKAMEAIMAAGSFDGHLDVGKKTRPPMFLAPEELQSGNTISGKACDIWSLGVALYCMTFAVVPFPKRGSYLDLYDAILNSDLTFPPSPVISADLRHLLTKMLEKDVVLRMTLAEIKDSAWCLDSQTPSELARPLTSRSDTSFAQSGTVTPDFSRSDFARSPIPSVPSFTSVLGDTQGLLEEAQRLPCNVLVVEDVFLMRQVVVNMLSHTLLDSPEDPVTIDMVADGSDAFEAFRWKRYRLILMDLHMHRMNGLESTGKIRDWEQGQGLPRCIIIGLTADSVPDIPSLCLKVGMDSMVLKPLKMITVQEISKKYGLPLVPTISSARMLARNPYAFMSNYQKHICAGETEENKPDTDSLDRFESYDDFDHTNSSKDSPPSGQTVAKSPTIALNRGDLSTSPPKVDIQPAEERAASESVKRSPQRRSSINRSGTEGLKIEVFAPSAPRRLSTTSAREESQGSPNDATIARYESMPNMIPYPPSSQPSLTPPLTSSHSDTHHSRRFDFKDTSKSGSGTFVIPSPQRVSVTKRVAQVRTGVDSAGKKYINEYTLLNEMGTGTYGVVYHAVNTINDKPFALKVANKHQLNKGAGDYQLEMDILGKLDHPNIVRVFEILDQPDLSDVYFVLEYAEGGSVMSIDASGKSNQGPFTEDRARVVMQQVIHGLEYLHARNIVHRDIKPDNIMVSGSGVIKIGDFGVSHLFESGNDNMRAISGTPLFHAPEICKGLTYSGKAADIWALGITLYAFVFGQVPFQVANLFQLYHEIQTKDIQFPDKPKLSTSLRALLRRMLTKDVVCRITLPEIKDDPWMTGKKSIVPVKLPRSKGSPQPISNFQGHILVVEDVYIIRELVTNMFNSVLDQDADEGFHVDVDVVCDGEQAVSAIKSGKVYRLVLMDVHMPVKSGYEATVEIREFELNSHSVHKASIVGFTADPAAAKPACLAVGMNDIVPKPMTPMKLCNLLPQYGFTLKHQQDADAFVADTSSRMAHAFVVELAKRIEAEGGKVRAPCAKPNSVKASPAGLVTTVHRMDRSSKTSNSRNSLSSLSGSGEHNRPPDPIADKMPKSWSSVRPLTSSSSCTGTESPLSTQSVEHSPTITYQRASQRRTSVRTNATLLHAIDALRRPSVFAANADITDTTVTADLGEDKSLPDDSPFVSNLELELGTPRAPFRDWIPTAVSSSSDLPGPGCETMRSSTENMLTAAGPRQFASRPDTHVSNAVSTRRGSHVVFTVVEETDDSDEQEAGVSTSQPCQSQSNDLTVPTLSAAVVDVKVGGDLVVEGQQSYCGSEVSEAALAPLMESSDAASSICSGSLLATATVSPVDMPSPAIHSKTVSCTPPTDFNFPSDPVAHVLEHHSIDDDGPSTPSDPPSTSPASSLKNRFPARNLTMLNADVVTGVLCRDDDPLTSPLRTGSLVEMAVVPVPCTMTDCTTIDEVVALSQAEMRSADPGDLTFLITSPRSSLTTSPSSTRKKLETPDRPHPYSLAHTKMISDAYRHKGEEMTRLHSHELENVVLSEVLLAAYAHESLIGCNMLLPLPQMQRLRQVALDLMEANEDIKSCLTDPEGVIELEVIQAAVSAAIHAHPPRFEKNAQNAFDFEIFATSEKGKRVSQEDTLMVVPFPHHMYGTLELIPDACETDEDGSDDEYSADATVDVQCDLPPPAVHCDPRMRRCVSRRSSAQELCCCVAVFDGHGGRAASVYAQQQLVPHFLRSREFRLNGQACMGLKHAFHRTNRMFNLKADAAQHDAGTTALVVFLQHGGRVLNIANLGDCRVVACTADGKAIDLTTDHKPDVPREKRRIEHKNGEVLFYCGAQRVQGMLTVARALGSRPCRQYLSASPEMTEVLDEQSDEYAYEFLCVASDGLWSVFNSQEIVDFIREARSEVDANDEDDDLSYQCITDALVDRCITERNAADNVTVICIFFKKKKTQLQN